MTVVSSCPEETAVMKNLKLLHKLSLIVIISLAGFIVFGLVFKNTLDTLKIRGPLYQRIIEGKDLLADILPPPEYILESYLVVLQAREAATPAEITVYEDQLHKLQGEYETRQAYWMKTLVEQDSGELKRVLSQEVHPPAMVFYEIARKQYFPALKARDYETARRLASQTLRPRYEEHRAAVDKLVKIATQRSSDDENAADAINYNRMVFLLIIGITIIGTTALAGLFIIRDTLKPVGIVHGAACRAAEGDLSGDVTVASKDEIGEMARSFNAMTTKIREMVSDMNASTTTLASNAVELSATSDHMSKGAHDLSSHVEQIATAMNEVSQTIVNMARDANQGADASRNASEAAAKGKLMVDSTVDDMARIAKIVQAAADTIEELGKSSMQIGAIVTVINGIAEQTNLLALNASIESARAGEQGRGFAVVADEVRNLAERTSQATKDIAQRIESIQQAASRSVIAVKQGSDEVGKGVALARDASASLEAIVTASASAMDMVNRIATATEEQSAAVEQISASMNDISHIAKSSSDATDQIKGSAEALARLASDLKITAARFRLSQSERMPALDSLSAFVPERASQPSL